MFTTATDKVLPNPHPTEEQTGSVHGVQNKGSSE